jgi:hypothetical protein
VSSLLLLLHFPSSLFLCSRPSIPSLPPLLHPATLILAGFYPSAFSPPLRISLCRSSFPCHHSTSAEVLLLSDLSSSLLLLSSSLGPATHSPLTRGWTSNGLFVNEGWVS